jgi:copper chaperone CopZ
VVLWIASIAVLAFALLPYVAGPFAAKISQRKIADEKNNQSASQLADSTTAVSTNGTEAATFKIEGMTCVACETTIRLTLKRSPGVLRADVSYANGTARVEYDPRKTTPDKLREAITKTGYKASESK